VLMRSEVIAGFLVCVAALGWQYKKQAMPGVLLCLTIGLATEGAWVFHNYRSLGKPVLTTTAGLNLFRGNGPTATGGSYQWNGEAVWDTPETVAAKKQLTWSRDYEIATDAVYRDELKRSLASDPLRPIKLLPAKFLFYWTADFSHPKGKSPVAWLPWVLLLAPIIIGMRAFWKSRGETWPLYFWTGFYLVIVLVFFSLPRYRMSVEPMFLIFAAAGIHAWRNRGLAAELK